ncbi:MAG: hypothetical protein A3A96_02300 [Candidatus Zambryskibacteria bacterium RIFCSPLOWO2_01_FULL_39_39]|uniref:Uncharacterized protein n=1 Tax=Candidatus Zambryskibacteria bacterium RIFCSPLOWO2_01_FULL_39_39 TaxID=1802758 RepID=A0A1G2TYF2_9BACT|nr:MAG: hypothetical protein A2644_03085 [Candidatus Zambryskibacteria bacterium RIFCSPHIGHO2_01_FULL_39_63]OHB02264.1 MAG: hypothetical protein A3A96_02300 [Candidatus Zambryskibacteria bacterium RIFCSPLOWO2_01_FULL_39_39]
MPMYELICDHPQSRGRSEQTHQFKAKNDNRALTHVKKHVTDSKTHPYSDTDLSFRYCRPKKLFEVVRREIKM